MTSEGRCRKRGCSKHMYGLQHEKSSEPLNLPQDDIDVCIANMKGMIDDGKCERIKLESDKYCRLFVPQLVEAN